MRIHYFPSNEAVYPLCGHANANGTRYPEDVTCRRCIRMMENAAAKLAATRCYRREKEEGR